MKTDVHNHVIPKAALDLFRAVPAYGVEITADRWHGGNHVDFELLPSFVNVEAKLAELEHNGVDRAVLSAAPPLFYYELEPDLAAPLCDAVNTGMADFHASVPDRLWWMAHVPLQDLDTAVSVLEGTADERGCVGVEIGSSIAGRRLDEPEFDRFWATAERLSMPVMIHPDPTYTRIEPLEPYYLRNVIGMPLETTITIMRIIAAGVLERHPGLSVLLAHGGGYFPYQGGRLKHAVTVRPELASSPPDPWDCLDQLWFDVITHDAQALEYLVSRVEAGHVVLGTDLPFDMALRDPVGQVTDALGPRLAREVTEDNPARLFALDVPTAMRGGQVD